MGREIEFQIGDEIAVAALMDDKAPKTCDAIWEALPCRGTAVHAKIAGAEFFFKVPIFLDYLENPTKEQQEGNIAYWETGQSICVFYDNVPGVGYANTFARIKKNLAGIKKEGMKCWKKQGTPVEIRRKESGGR